MICHYLSGWATLEELERQIENSGTNAPSRHSNLGAEQNCERWWGED
jgi:hypothetical protein